MVELKYPTRTFNEPRLIKRKDPVVWPKKEGMKVREIDNWNAKSRAFYEENGFCVMNNVFSPEEVKRFKEEVDNSEKAFKEWKHEGKELPKHLPKETLIPEKNYENELRSVFKIHQNNDLFKRVMADKRIYSVAQDILGDDELYIHQSRINLQPPFVGGGFEYHSDFESWHCEDGLQDMRQCSFVIMTEENTGINGALMVVPKTHKTFISCVGKTPKNNWEQSLRSQKIGTPDYETVRQLVNENGMIYCEGKPGDVLVFDCNLLHVSHNNVSPFSRKNVFFVYNSLNNKPKKTPFNRPRYIATQDEEIKEIKLLEHFDDASSDPSNEQTNQTADVSE